MKISTALIAIFLLLGFGSWAQESPLDSLIRYYNEYPQEALKQAEKMQVQALETKNKALYVKSLILKNTYSLRIDPNNFSTLIQGLEREIKQEKDTIIQCLLHSYIAQLYIEYYYKNDYTIDQRLYLNEFTSENPEEWSGNLFKERVFKHTEASIRPEAILQKTPISDYLELFLSPKTIAPTPTLYDFLCYRAMDILPKSHKDNHTGLFDNPAILSDVKTFTQTDIPLIALNGHSYILNIWQKLLRFHLRDTQPDALIVMDLERLEYAPYNNRSNRDSLLLATLGKMRETYKESPVSVEIIAVEAGLLAQVSIPIPIFRFIHRTGMDELAGKQQALAQCREGVRLFPKYERINLLHQIINDLTAPGMDVSFPKNNYPGETINIKVSSKNIKTATIEITRIDTSFLVYRSFRKNNNNKYPKTKVFEKSYSLKSSLVYQDTSIQVQVPQSGLYEISVKTPGSKKDVREELWVSQLFATHLNINNQQIFRVCDWKNGKPVKNATIYIYKDNYHLLDSAYTNAQGMATFTTKGDYFQVVNKENTQGDLNFLNTPYFRENNENHTTIITDRKIYRPGQTVYFKGLAWTSRPDTLWGHKNITFTVNFYVNYNKKIGSQTLISNDFGTFAGSFVIPRDILNGSITIASTNGSTRINVAEYKRPEFEITFDESKPVYYIGDTVRIRGHISSFSGVNLANNRIQYKITKQKATQVSVFKFNEDIQGVTTTDADGKFEFSFIATSSSPIRREPYFHIHEISVTATDPKGETHEKETQVLVYFGEVIPRLSLPKEVNKDIPTPFFISLADMPPSATPKKVTYSISKLVSGNQPQFPDGFRDTIIEKTILEGELLMTQNDSITPILRHYPSGAYLVSIKCEKNTTSQIFFLYGSKDKKPPIATYSWVVKEKTKCLPGEKARVLFGTSVSDAHVVYEIYSPEKLIKRKFITLSNGIIPIEIPYLAEYGRQIWLIVSYVKDKNFIQEVIPIQQIYTNRKLIVETKVFRDKLTPGEKEEWVFRITNEQGLPVKAELLAMMYDASLDQLSHNDIDFHPELIYFGMPYEWRSGRYDRQGNLYLFYKKNYPLPSYLTYKNYFHDYTYLSTQFYPFESDLFCFETPEKSISNIRIAGSGKQMKTNTDIAEAIVTGYGRNTDAKHKDSFENIYRQNFQETAFFYPQLVSDSLGCVSIKFTIPESMTKWKLMAVANTPDMAAGELTKYIVTSKPLMLRPNLPRFLRSGDRAEIKVTISNLSDTLQAGNATFELFSPISNQQMITQNIPFEVVAGQSQTLNYSFDVPQQMDAIGCRMLATSGHFSDGEQQLLPILPDETPVTVTQPFYTNEKGEHSYTLAQNSNTRKDYRLTLEITGNPVWYAIMALPPLLEPRSDNASDIASAYYVNTVATMIAHSNPQIVEGIRSWQTANNQPATLRSKLEQNPELKSILLSVTPWALQAENETERIQMLANLFDDNRLSYLQDQALDKLSALQSADGGWCWFKGMPTSRFITMDVLNAMFKANTSGQKEYGEREKQMQAKALRYLDNEIKKDFKDKSKSIDYNQILYLYTRSLFRDIPLGDALDAHKFFIALAKKGWHTFSLYEKALTALTFHRYGFKEDAGNILRSLKEYSKTTPELGMFWPTNRNHYYRNSAVQVQAAIMEAFYEIEGSSDKLDLMKQWILLQKQTQMWGSVPSTVDAIHLLLKTGKGWLNAANPVKVTLGNHQIPPPSGSDPLGYLKATYTNSEIKPDMLTIKINKSTNTPSWGCLYLQYFEKIDRIEKQKGVLGIDKKLFVEKASHNGKNELKPIDKETLKVGDKIIVRLTLSLTRDMEFLHLQDLRAGCLEPTEQLSGNHWQFGTVYYQESKDACTNFFFTTLRQGTYVIEYPVWVNQAGEYQDGIATFESIYAPEYNAFSGSIKIKVEN